MPSPGSSGADLTHTHTAALYLRPPVPLSAEDNARLFPLIQVSRAISYLWCLSSSSPTLEPLPNCSFCTAHTQTSPIFVPPPRPLSPSLSKSPSSLPACFADQYSHLPLPVPENVAPTNPCFGPLAGPALSLLYFSSCSATSFVLCSSLGLLPRAGPPVLLVSPLCASKSSWSLAKSP